MLRFNQFLLGEVIVATKIAGQITGLNDFGFQVLVAGRQFLDLCPQFCCGLFIVQNCFFGCQGLVFQLLYQLTRCCQRVVQICQFRQASIAPF